MSLIELSAFLRGVIYLWVSLTSFSVYQLYRDGYDIAGKNSPIIVALMKVIFWVSMVFGYYSISSFVQAFDINAHEVFAYFSPIIVLPLGILLTKFRRESVKQPDKE